MLFGSFFQVPSPLFRSLILFVAKCPTNSLNDGLISSRIIDFVIQQLISDAVLILLSYMGQ